MAAGDAVETAYRTILTMLERGVYRPGTRLPGERELAGRIKVSRSTLRLALNRLAEERALVASPQRGWFVPGLLLGEPASSLLSFSELAASRGLRAGARELERVVRPATLTEAEDLQIAPASNVLELVRLRSMDEVPISVETAILPHRLVEWIDGVDLTDSSLYALLAEHGIEVYRSSYSVQAVNADQPTANLLGVSVGCAVLLARDVTVDVERHAVMTTLNRFRGDAYRFTADLFRAQS